MKKGLGIITRHMWGAASFKDTHVPIRMTHVQRIVIHHAAGSQQPFDSRTTHYEAACAAARAMQRFHQVDRKWLDIAYHFLISPHGHILEGRQALPSGHPVIGSHVKGFNGTSLGVCVLGDYSSGNTLSPEAQEALVALCAQLCARYDLDPTGQTQGQTIVGHSDLSATTCPGSIGRQLEEIRQLVEAVRSPQIVIPAEVTGAGMDIYHPVGADRHATAEHNRKTLGDLLGAWAEDAEDGAEIVLRVEHLTRRKVADLPEA